MMLIVNTALTLYIYIYIGTLEFSATDTDVSMKCVILVRRNLSCTNGLPGKSFRTSLASNVVNNARSSSMLQ